MSRKNVDPNVNVVSEGRPSDAPIPGGPNVAPVIGTGGKPAVAPEVGAAPEVATPIAPARPRVVMSQIQSPVIAGESDFVKATRNRLGIPAISDVTEPVTEPMTRPAQVMDQPAVPTSTGYVDMHTGEIVDTTPATAVLGPLDYTAAEIKAEQRSQREYPYLTDEQLAEAEGILADPSLREKPKRQRKSREKPVWAKKPRPMSKKREAELVAELNAEMQAQGDEWVDENIYAASRRSDALTVDAIDEIYREQTEAGEKAAAQRLEDMWKYTGETPPGQPPAAPPPPPPSESDEGGEDEGPSSPASVYPKPQRLISKIAQRIEIAVAAIRENLADGRFPLKGDTEVDVYSGGKKIGTATVHSDEVYKAMAHIAKVLGYTDVTVETLRNRKDTWFEVQLFKAFQIYRGMSLDRNGMLFGKDPKQVTITDEKFIQTIDEMISNIRSNNFPFAYNFAHVRVAGRERYPVIATMGIANFFCKNQGQGSELDMTAEGFIEHNKKEWRETVEPRMKRMAEFDQQESLQDMIDAVVDEKDELHRLPNSRASMMEFFDPASEWAIMFFGDAKRLGLIMASQKALEERARNRVEKRRARGANDAHKPKNATDAAQDPERWAADATRQEPTGRSIARTLTNFMRTIPIIGNPVLAATGTLEKGFGVLDQRVSTWALRMLMGGTYQASDATKERLHEDDHMTAFEECMKILTSEGVEGLVNAAARGVRFTKKGAADIEGRFKHIASLQNRSAALVRFAMRWSTGDLFFKKATMDVFIEHYIYQLERSQKDGWNTPADGSAPARLMTPEMVETFAESDADGFWSMVARTPEGIAALRFAADTSIAGIDPLSNSLRLATRNSVTDMTVGFVFGWYLKYGMRFVLKMTPFSNALIYIGKRGFTDKVRAATAPGALGSAEAIADSDMYAYGANEDFWRGLAEVTIVDMCRFGRQATVYTLVYGIIAMLGGIQPPDDDEDEVNKKHLWYEWKIGGHAIKENWYWMDLLGFAMPFAVGAHAYKVTGDANLAYDIFMNGVEEKLNDSPWTNVTDLVEFMNNFDQKFVAAADIAEGYDQSGDISKKDFGITQAKVWLIKRAYASLEPGVLRSIYNDHGLWMGDIDLDHSPNTVFTGETRSDGTPDTKMTSWSDAQIRRATKSSRFAGTMMNILTGYYLNNGKQDKTSYIGNEMPLISVTDPMNQMWANTLSVPDPDDIYKNNGYVPYDKWTEEQRTAITNEVLRVIAEFYDPKTGRYLASDAKACGIVIPYDARAATVELLNAEWGAIRSRYYKRVADGEFYYKKLGIPYEVAKTRQNAAYDEHLTEQAKVQDRVDFLFSDEIPYSAMKYNRRATNWRVIYTWKEGTEHAGEPAFPFDAQLHPADVEVTRYPAGDRPSSFLPFLTVEDMGENTYDAQTPAGWQNKATDMKYVMDKAKGYIVPDGMFEGQDLWDILSGAGAVGPEATRSGSWDQGKLLFGLRAHQPVEVRDKKLDRKDFPKPKVEVTASSDGGRLTWGSGGGGSYTPSIYSHPAYSLNADRPASLFSKTPSYARFDYLRPSVETKGSREAYRREDF